METPTRRKRSPQAWAITIVSIVENLIGKGRTLPFDLPEIKIPTSGGAIRVLQEVGFAHTWLDAAKIAASDQEIASVHKYNKEKKEATPTRRVPIPYQPLTWSIKRKEDPSTPGSFTFVIGLPTSGSRSRAGTGLMEQLLNPQFEILQKTSGAPTIEEIFKQQQARESHAANAPPESIPPAPDLPPSPPFEAPFDLSPSAFDLELAAWLAADPSKTSPK